MTTIVAHKQVSRFGKPFTLVMVEGMVNDVATYECTGHVDAWECFAIGTKWTERDNGIDGFPVPEGKHYRR